jgi:dihydrofolate reductase
MAVARLRAHNFAISLDGYGAGAAQSVDDPLGRDGERLHDWVFETRYGRHMIGEQGGVTGVDDDFLARGDDNIGAHVMGRNMFGPVRGEWGSEEWRGWWGDNPPYHHPVFVLTHHAHNPIEMEGGTTFFFVTDGIESALAQAFDAAGGQDVRLGGGVSTVQQYVRAGLLDELHVPVVPVLLGSGERLFDGLDDAFDSYKCTELVTSGSVAHFVFSRVTR